MSENIRIWSRATELVDERFVAESVDLRHESPIDDMPGVHISWGSRSRLRRRGCQAAIRPVIAGLIIELYRVAVE